MIYDAESLKRGILANNLVGKLMETVKLLSKVYPKDELKWILDTLANMVKAGVEPGLITYYNSDKPTKLKLVTSWEYKEEDFE
jgi:hypothetical protein